MKQIINLNLLNTDYIIKDDNERFYVVNSMSEYEKGYITLTLIEFNEYFTNWNITLPIACDKQLYFTSKNDKDFSFKFWETEVLKNKLSQSICKIINELS